MKIMATIEKKIKRGKEGWNFIYFVFGFLFAIVTFLIGIIPASWCYKIIIFAVVTSVLIWLCLLSAWFQNKIIGLKIKLEDTWKKI